MDHISAATSEHGRYVTDPIGGRSARDSRIALPRHEEALARLEYVTSRQRGFALLTGPAGCGKTVLLRELVDGLRHRSVLSVHVDACGCTEADLLRECCDELGLGCAGDCSIETLHWSLLEALRGRCTVGTPVVLIFDHADRSDDQALRIIERLLHAMPDLTGPTVVAASREPAPAALAALARDYADVRIQVPALSVDDTGELLETLCNTGGPHATLTPDAVDTVHSVADGELRQVHRLWRLLQTSAMIEEADSIDAGMIAGMAREMPSKAG